MSPIKGISEQVRLPRLGKIRLGRKVPNKSGEGEHPQATPYFVLPPELTKMFGEEGCTELPVMICTEDDGMWASQWYKRYSKTQGLTCKGDGETCERKIDTGTGAIADRDTKDPVVWKKGLLCEGKKCPDYMAKSQQCKEVMNLQFLMPDVAGLGVWQIDTSSINSIRNINDAARLIRLVYKRISFIPLLLTLEPKEVNNPDDGKKKTVRVLNLRTRGTIKELMASAAKPYTELLLPEPTDDAEDHQPIEEETETKVVTAVPAGAKQAEVKPATQSQTESERPVDFLKEPTTETKKGEGSKLKRDPATIKTTTDLIKVCAEDFKIDSKETLKEAGYDSWTMCTELPSVIYVRIHAARAG